MEALAESQPVFFFLADAPQTWEPLLKKAMRIQLCVRVKDVKKYTLGNGTEVYFVR